MFNLLKSFASDQSVATAIEYALIASLIAVAIVGALTSLGKVSCSNSPKSAATSSKEACASSRG